MGKMPLFRSLGLCWVGLAIVLATSSGCTTTPTRGKYPPRGTITEQPGFKQPPSSITNPGPGTPQKQPLDPFGGAANGVTSGQDKFPPPMPPMPGTTVNTTNRPPAAITPTSGGGFEQSPKAQPGAFPGNTGPGTSTGPFGAIDSTSKSQVIGSTPTPLPAGPGAVTPIATDMGKAPNPFATTSGAGLAAPGNGVLPPSPPVVPGRDMTIPGALPAAPPIPNTNSTSGYTPGVPTTTTTAPPVGLDPQPYPNPGAAGVPLPPISGPQ